MPGRIVVAPGLPADDGGFLAGFAGGGEEEAALFATRSLLERWRDEALAKGRALGGRRFFLFSGLARAILGPGAPVPDAEAVRRRAASLALAELAAQGRLRTLAPLAGSGYLAADALNALGELKRNLVPPERAALLTPALADLVAAWRIWRKKIVDEEDLLLRACLLLEGRDPPGLEWRSLLVHGFTDFSPLQARLLQGLAGRGVAVTILLPDAAPFAPLAQLRRRLLDQFPGWEVLTADGSTGGPEPFPARETIELSAEGALASLIARTIRARLAADPGLAPDDIALVRRTAEAGSPFIAALRRHGLPVAEETGPPLRRLNSVGVILAALAAVVRDWPRGTIMRLARGIFAGRDAGLAESLGRISAELRVVRTRAAWEVLLDPVADAGGDPEIEPARRALAVLAEGLSLIPERGTPGDYRRALRALVERWDLPANWWPQNGDDAALAAYAANMAGLEAIFAHLEAIAAAEDRFGGQRTWEAGEILGELERVAGEACLPAPKAGGGIRCLNPSEIRGLRFRLVFLVGLAEGEFPKAMAENWLLPEEMRRSLAADGYRLDLRPTLAAREWQLLANVANAAETLFLCWSRTDARGEGAVASPFLLHLRELCAPLPRVDLPAGEVLPARPGEAWDDQSRLGRLVADLLWTSRAGEADGAAAAAVLAAYEQSRQEVAAVIERARSDRDGRAGDLTAAEFRRQLADRFGPDRIVSTSALEDYALCPFLFFARRLLGLAGTRRPDEDLDALDLGLAYHAALEKLFRRLGPARLDRREWPRYEEAAAAAAAEAFAHLAARARTPAARRLIDQGREGCRRSLLGLLRVETRRAERGSPWRIAHAELGFGLEGREDLDPASTREPLVLGEGPGRIRLSGKIDRVDLAPGRYFAVYDYKRGRAPAPADVRSGRTLQIPVYLLAVAALIHPELEPAGGGYYSLRDLARAAGLWRSELADLTGISTRAAGSLDEEEWREAMEELTDKILAAAAGIRAGSFPPTEEPCPPFCEYAEVCRKDQ